MLVGMRDMTRGVMLPRWPWKIMHTRGESIFGFLKHRFAVNGNVKKLSIAFKPSQKYLI